MHTAEGVLRRSSIFQMPARSEKHANFRRLAESRTEVILDAIRKLSNLSSPNYEFEDGEVDRIFAAIEEALEEARGKFRRDLHKRSRFRL
jgi:hypothetical protein